MKFNQNMLIIVVISGLDIYLVYQDLVPGKGTDFSLFHNTHILGATQPVKIEYLQAPFHYPRERGC